MNFAALADEVFAYYSNNYASQELLYMYDVYGYSCAAHTATCGPDFVVV